VNCETYNFDISLHKTPQIKSREKKDAEAQIQPFRIAYKNFPRIKSHPSPTVRAILGHVDYGWGK